MRGLARRSIPAAVALALLAAVAGCTSDPSNRLGSGVVTPEFEVDLVPVSVDQVTAYTALSIEDEKRPLSQRQTLYLGQQAGLESAILANYDFDDLFSEDYPETLFTAEMIKSVKFSLTMLDFYGTASNDDGTIQIYYDINQLTAPFDTTTTAWPGAVPSFEPTPLNADPLELHGKEPLIDMREADFLDWLADGSPRGFVIRAGADSDPGLVGYAARELTRYNELDDVAVGTVVGPNLVIEFEDVTIPSYLLRPTADTATFHAVPSAPADPSDRIILRTGLRSYPALTFDFSAVPADVYINRAVLWVANDTTTAFGNLEALVVAEFDSTLFGDPFADLTLADLGAEVYTITGQTSIDPTAARHIGFDVTAAVQRRLNGVYEGRRGLVLAAGEDFFGSYDLTLVDPEFYVTQFDFYGTAAPDSLRPRLEVTYSAIEELGGGE